MSKIQISSRTETIDHIIQELFSFHRFGIKPGLENIATLLQTADSPQSRYPTIHVAGTNGKGTVSSVLASILMEAGYKVGLYTSPHILRFNERIRVNGEEISDEEIASLAELLLPKTREIAGTFFEATTAMAFRHFADCAVDIAVIETGLGGRLDSTNVLSPLLSIITSIDLDHTDFLGTTLAEIAWEKAGIMKTGIPVIIGEPRQEIREVFDRTAAEKNAPVLYVDDGYHTTVHEYYPDFSMLMSIVTPEEKIENMRIPFSGEHMARNMAIVLAACDVLNHDISAFSLSQKAIMEGIVHVRRNSGLKGRIELLQAQPPLVLDVSHNSAGIDALARTIQKSGYEDICWQIVFGAMKDKAVDAMIAAFRPIAARMYAAAPMVERAMPPQDIQHLAEEYEIPCVPCASVNDALCRALATGQPTLITGSFYLAEEAILALQKLENR